MRALTLASPNLRQCTIRSVGPWIVVGLLFATLPEGFSISYAGRTPSVTFFDLALVLVCTFLAWETLFGDYQFDVGEKRLFHLAVLYFFFLMFSTLLHMGDVLRGFNAARVFIFGFVVYIACVSLIKSRHDLRLVVNGLIVWGSTVGFLLAYQFFYHWQFDLSLAPSYDAKNEISLSMGRSNYVAAMLVLILPIAFANLAEKKRWARLKPVVAIALIMLGLLITASKGAFIAIAAGFILSLPFLRKAGLKPWQLLIFGMAALGYLLILPGHLIEYNYEMILFRLYSPDLTRYHLWVIAWGQFLQHPFFGVGPGNIYLYNLRAGEQDLYTHNYILGSLAELGIVGAIPFFLMLGVLVKNAYRVCIRSFVTNPHSYVPLALFIGLICTLVHGLVEPTFVGEQYAVVFWACMGLVTIFDRATNDPFRIWTRRTAFIGNTYFAGNSSKPHKGHE